MAEQTLTKTIVFGLVAATFGVGTYLGISSFSKSDEEEKTQPNPTEVAGKEQSTPETVKEIIPDEKKDESSIDEGEARPDMNAGFHDPAELVTYVMEKMSHIQSEEELQDLAEILWNGKASTDELAQLNKLYEEKRIKLRDENPMELLGEVKAGKISRWALHLSDDSKFQLQTARQKNGKWEIDQVTLPLSNVDENGNALTTEQIKKRAEELEVKDSLVFSNQFLKTLVNQNFEKARTMANDGNISDAKIAALCILFEDEAYKLNQQKPIQAVRMTEKMSAFYVNVKASDGSDGQFSVNTLRDDVNSPWKINEINLDRLLEDYSKRIAGGDVHYTPLIKSPNGGDMLVIYFEFDSNGLTERTKKQLDIVADLLKLDNRKKVRLSGHTDGKGSNQYNQGLSEKRAVSVKEYLATQGIKPEQIVTEAHGFSKPRRPDTKEDGTDDPGGRRANRRTEIYLDF